MATLEVESGWNVESVADGFARIWSRSLLAAVDASGRLILENVYDGDVALVRKRGPKERSLAELSRALERRGIRMRAGRLRRLVHQHLVIQDLRATHGSIEFERLTPSHVDEVVSLPRARRLRLLEEVEARGMTVRELRDRVRRAGRTAGASVEAEVGANADELCRELRRLERQEAGMRRTVEQLPRRSQLDRRLRVRLLGLAIRIREIGERLEGSLEHASAPAARDDSSSE